MNSLQFIYDLHIRSKEQFSLNVDIKRNYLSWLFFALKGMLINGRFYPFSKYIIKYPNPIKSSLRLVDIKLRQFRLKKSMSPPNEFTYFCFKCSLVLKSMYGVTKEKSLKLIVVSRKLKSLCFFFNSVGF